VRALWGFVPVFGRGESLPQKTFLEKPLIAVSGFSFSYAPDFGLKTPIVQDICSI
jgi:hypothetical protein